MMWERENICLYYGSFFNHAMLTKELITAETCQPNIPRKGKNFWAITDVNSPFYGLQAPEGSYSNSGWDEAHLGTIAAYMFHQGNEAMAEAAMCGLNRAPQKPSLNRRLFGDKLEPYLKEKVYDIEEVDGKKVNVAKYEKALVYTGVGLTKKKGGNNSSSSTVNFIGSDSRQVAIPDVWFKAVLAKPFDESEYEQESWLFDNNVVEEFEYTGKENLHEFYKPMSLLQKYACVDFMPKDIPINGNRINWNFNI